MKKYEFEYSVTLNYLTAALIAILVFLISLLITVGLHLNTLVGLILGLGLPGYIMWIGWQASKKFGVLKIDENSIIFDLHNRELEFAFNEITSYSFISHLDSGGLSKLKISSKTSSSIISVNPELCNAQLFDQACTSLIKAIENYNNKVPFDNEPETTLGSFAANPNPEHKYPMLWPNEIEDSRELVPKKNEQTGQHKIEREDNFYQKKWPLRIILYSTCACTIGSVVGSITVFNKTTSIGVAIFLFSAWIGVMAAFLKKDQLAIKDKRNQKKRSQVS